MSNIEEADYLKFKENMNLDISSEATLKRFINILDVYQKKMNLIGKSTRSVIWSRHILDSAQVLQYLDHENKRLFTLDVGTGAGFPGVVLAILGRKDLLLCEKSTKKCNYLNIIAKECNLKVKIFNSRVEDLGYTNIKTIISRAFAPLKMFLYKIKHLIYPNTVLILHKGKNYMQEIKEAQSFFSFNYKFYDSITNSKSKILKIDNVQERNE